MLANRSSQRTAGDAGLDGVDGALRAEALVEAQREPSGCHGREWCGGGGCEADEQVSSSALLRCRQASDVFALPGTSAQERSIRLSTNHVRPFIQSTTATSRLRRGSLYPLFPANISPTRRRLYHLAVALTTAPTMASTLRPTLLRQALAAPAKRVYTSAVPAFRAQQQRLSQRPSWTLQRAAFQTSASRQILPPLPQVIKGTVNDPVNIPEPHPSHGSYHWTAER